MNEVIRMLNRSVLENPMLSLWLKDGINVELNQLKENEQTDVLIAGAGITGITAAYLLKKQGLDVVLIDKDSPLSLASGNTTAKFTFQHSLIYDHIIETYGIDEACLYYKAQREAMKLVRDIIKEHNIDCDLKETYACVYAKDPRELEALKEEQRAYQKINVQSEIVYDDPHNLGYTGALRVNDQFEINPVKYLSFMLNYLLEKNVRIYKDTMAMDIKGKGPYTVDTQNGYHIETKSVIVSTGYPFFEANSMYYARLEAMRSYLTAYKMENTQPDEGMFISIDEDSPYSVRFSDTDGERYVLVGGQGHKVGQERSETKDYKKLIDFAFRHFHVQEVAYRWSAQDYRSVDKIPYIGQISPEYPDVYIATGYNKWGMTNGSFAAILISSMIKERKTNTSGIINKEELILDIRNIKDDKSIYQQLFNPSRGEISSNIGSFLKSNMNVAKELIKSKLTSSGKSISELAYNEGAIIKKNGKKLAVFKDNDGKVYIHSAVCTHLGCDLEYNDAEKSFDCPCHGSRFSSKGKVIEGPAMMDLKKEDLIQDKEAKDKK